MKKASRLLIAFSILLISFGKQVQAAPPDALFYADFNTGPLAEPEHSMQATEKGGTLYINNGPIDCQASIVDGALKLTLGPSGYYGMGCDLVKFRDESSKLTDYKYLVLRMKGERGKENVVGNGAPMMVIGGGDGPHIGTFLNDVAGIARPFRDPYGNPMPTLTTEYQDFVIALTEDNVRINPGKAMSGINFNNAVSTITLYIDEIYLTNTIPEGYKNNNAVTTTTTSATEGTTSAKQNGATTPGRTNTSTTSSGDLTVRIVMIVIVSVALLLNIAILALLIRRIQKLSD